MVNDIYEKSLKITLYIYEYEYIAQQLLTDNQC